jgi:hypothetical protein
MTIRTITLAIAAVLLVAAPAAASANPPVRDTVEVRNTVQDLGEHCGFPVRWNIHMVVDRTRWFDDAGQLLREVHQVSEDNTVENLASGKTVRDGPVRFTRFRHYENGVRIYTIDAGVMVNVRDGRERLLDAGLVKYRILPDGRWDIIRAVGIHPAYEALDGNQFVAALGAFCRVLD